MKKNSSKSSFSGRRQSRPSSRDRKKRKKDDSRLVGFTTLTHVAGLPKSHSFHSRIPVPDSPVICEPHDECAICGNPIENRSLAMSTPDGGYAHFDWVLEKIRKENPVGENQTISYNGKGVFAVIRKEEDGSWIIERRIQYEYNAGYQKVKAYVQENRK